MEAMGTPWTERESTTTSATKLCKYVRYIRGHAGAAAHGFARAVFVLA